MPLPFEHGWLLWYSFSMKYRSLGKTGYRVSEIGFGTWGLGRDMWKGAEDGTSMRALHEAVDDGVNFVDTALVYGHGHSEKLVGRLLSERSERIYVATKISPKNRIWPATGSLSEVFPASYIRQCTELSLRNLGVEQIDVQQLHVWDSSWLEQAEWFDALSQLREEGKIAHFGVSINDHEPDSALELVRSGKIDSVQVIFNVFDQSPLDRLFPLCAESRVGVIVRVPFDEGGLTGKIRPDTVFPARDWRNLYFQGKRKEEVYERVGKLESLLEEGEDLPMLALRFCLHPDAVSTVIPGMRSVEHVRANTAVSELPPFPVSRLRALHRHRWIRNFYPPA